MTWMKNLFKGNQAEKPKKPKPQGTAGPAGSYIQNKKTVTNRLDKAFEYKKKKK